MDRFRAPGHAKTFGVLIASSLFAFVPKVSAQEGCIADFARQMLICPEGQVPLPQSKPTPSRPLDSAPKQEGPPSAAPSGTPTAPAVAPPPPAATPAPPVVVPAPPSVPTVPTPPPANFLPGATDESAESIRNKFYQAMMVYVRQLTVTRGRPQFVNLKFERAYAIADKPKALAICVNWGRTTPNALTFYSGSSQFQFVTKSGSCGPRNETQARSCAISDCRRYARCSPGESCAVIDINDRNVLELPTDWTKRYLRSQQ